MELGIGLSVFLVLMVIITINEGKKHKKQEALEEKISHLAYQKDDLISITQFLLRKNTYMSEKLKQDIEDLTADMATGNSDDEKIQKKLDYVCQKIYNLERSAY